MPKVKGWLPNALCISFERVVLAFGLFKGRIKNDQTARNMGNHWLVHGMVNGMVGEYHIGLVCFLLATI